MTGRADVQKAEVLKQRLRCRLAKERPKAIRRCSVWAAAAVVKEVKGVTERGRRRAGRARTIVAERRRE